MSAKNNKRKSSETLGTGLAVAEPFSSPQEHSPDGSAPCQVTTFPSRQRLNVGLCAVLLALATFALYSRALWNDFVNYDDAPYVTQNAQVQQGLTQGTLYWALTTTAQANWHPLTWLSHALDYEIYGLNPVGHHSTSVLLHVFNVVLLFLLLQWTTKATGRSLLVAALFAFHPMNVESVAWVAERKNVLSMFFFLIALGAYGWYAKRPGVGRYLLVVLCFIVGLTAKPMIVTLPFVLLLLDFWPLRRVSNLDPPSPDFPVSQSPLWRLVVEKLPLFLIAALSSIVTLAVQMTVFEPYRRLPLATRAITALYAYFMYVAKAFWPTHLAAFYPYEGFHVSAWQALLCFLFLAGITLCVWRERSRTYLPVGWFWFLGTLIPVIGLIQVGQQAMADRYAYLPLIGIFVMVVWGIADWSGQRRLRPNWTIAVAGLALALLALLTWRQIGFWRSSYDLWTHALNVTQRNYVAEDYMGSLSLAKSLAVKSATPGGDAVSHQAANDANAHFQNAVRFNPDDALAHLNLGADFHDRGDLQDAIQQYKLVLSLSRDRDLIIKALSDLGAAYQQLGDYESSEHYYGQALALDPRNAMLLMKLGRLAMLKRTQQLAVSAASNPSPQGYMQLGALQEASGQVREAITSYKTALKMDPQLSDAQNGINRLSGRANQ